MRDFILSRRLIKPKDKVLVALSGGPDSVFLLYALLALRDELKISIIAGHLNHCLRGRESDRDEKFVKLIAKQEGIKLYSARSDVARYAKSHKLSIETAAREVRRDFLQKMAEKHKCQKIATGHNLNDQAETVLMHIIRGSGLNGLKGIPVVNGKFIRPMLGIGREEILEYLRVNKIEWREDSTNKSPDHTRNKIRLTLIPQLKKYNPQIIQSLSNLAESAGADLDLVDQISGQAFNQAVKIHKAKINIDLSLFNSYNQGLKKNIIRQIVSQFVPQNGTSSFETVQRCLQMLDSRKVGKRFELLPGIWLSLGYDSANIAKGPRVLAIKETEAKSKRLLIPGKTGYGGRWIVASLGGRQSMEKKLIKNIKTAYYDWEQLKNEEITIGSREQGESMVPFGASYRKKIKEIFIEAKIPQADRDLWPIIRAGGEIIWLAGLRRSCHAPVNGKTKNILKLELVK